MQKYIRNFLIIAHVDHGKTTLADRLIEFCSDYFCYKKGEQVLDSMELEKERGITIKAQCVRLEYVALNNITYILNIIDTPGHVDFFYEVSRSFIASDGALLLIDSSQGIQAQTVSNYRVATEHNNVIIPILNKIDLVTANVDRVKTEVCSVFSIKKSSILSISGKTGLGIHTLLERIVSDIPFPTGDVNNPLQCVVVDSWFDSYLGIVSLICVKNGIIRIHDKIVVKSTGKTYIVEKIGVFKPKKFFVKELSVGEIGFIIAGVKDIKDIVVGDTITTLVNGIKIILPLPKKIAPKVYAGFYPVENDCFDVLRKALERLKLNDFSLFYEVESSPTLGFGFRCGFLGTLHLEIIKERLEREFNIDIFVTIPTVTYQVYLRNSLHYVYIDNPTKIPDFKQIIEIKEPIALVTIYSPVEFLGKIMTLCLEKRGVLLDSNYINEQILFTFEIPLNEIIIDFFNVLKTITSGFASLDYFFIRFCSSDLVRLDILINGDIFDAFSSFVHRTLSYNKGKYLVTKLSEYIPKQLFDVSIQAAIGSIIISRETVRALRKDVTNKCYGGDITRKRKLLDKQKQGKKKMKTFGKVNIPKEIFIQLLGC
jgi:GTP-binding protein LepA